MNTKYNKVTVFKDTENKLSKAATIVSDISIPDDKPVALWGGGIELDKQIGKILKHCSPQVIIDRCKDGDYSGIPFVRKDNIDINDYFIIITTTKYSGEIRSFLVGNGRKEGRDFIMGSDPILLMIMQKCLLMLLHRCHCAKWLVEDHLDM